MKTVSVKASGNYDVIIGTDLISQIGKYASQIRSHCKAAVISDTNVWPIYGELVSASLSAAGFATIHFTFPAGEASKNANTYLEILNFLAENQVTRTDLVIALGGGVSKAGAFLLDAVRAEVAKLVMYKTMPYARIELAKLGPDAGIIGAAMLGL